MEIKIEIKTIDKGISGQAGAGPGRMRERIITAENESGLWIYRRQACIFSPSDNPDLIEWNKLYDSFFKALESHLIEQDKAVLISNSENPLT